MADKGLLISSLVAVVAVVALVTLMNGNSTGMLPVNYGALFEPTYPQLQVEKCPTGLTESDIVCTDTVDVRGILENKCWRTADLVCVDLTGEDNRARDFGKEERFIPRTEKGCLKTPPDENGNWYWQCS